MRALFTSRLLQVTRPSVLQQCKLSLGLSRAAFSAENTENTTEVCIVDPRTAFQDAPSTAASVVRLRIPRTFLPLMSAPKFELGQADDPMTSWVFGEPGEIFEYQFAGNVRTQSGWVSCITQQSWDELRASKDVSWEALESAAASADGGLRGSSPGQPFLFVGQILEAAGAAVYQKKEGNKLQGLMITTSDEEISTP